MGILLLIVVLIMAPFVISLGLHVIGNSKKGNITSVYLVGTFVLLLIFELLLIIAQITEVSFFTLTVTYAITVAVLFVSMAAVCFYSYQKTGRRLLPAVTKNRRMLQQEVLLLLAFLGLFCIYIYVLLCYEGSSNGEATLERIQTTLATDTVYSYLPQPGVVYEEVGIMTKLNPLPILFAVLCKVFWIDPSTLMYVLMPIFLMGLTCIVLSHWADFLFKKETYKDHNFIPKMGFLCLYLILVLGGDGDFIKYSSGSIHAGWQLETVCANVIFPLLVLEFLKIAICCLEKRKLSREKRREQI